MKYTVSGVCSRSVEFDIEDGIVKNVVFDGGCNGNTKGIAKLVEGMVFRRNVGADELKKWAEEVVK